MLTWRKIPLLKRLVPGVRKRWAALRWVAGYRVIAVDGINFLFHLANKDDTNVAFWGELEAAQIAFFRTQIQQKDCTLFLDVGANYGYYTFRLLTDLPALRAVAFEPDPRTYDKLRTNVLLNNM